MKSRSSRRLFVRCVSLAGVVAGALLGAPSMASAATSVFDGANRLVSTTEGSTTVTYAYDGLGNLAKRCVNGACTDLVLDDASSLAHVVGEAPAGGSTATTYAYGPAGVAAQRGAAPSYPITDSLGTVRGLADALGAVVGRRATDAFGATRSVAGSTSGVGYAGEYTGAEDDRVWLRARSYDPKTGRFDQRDTFEGRTARPGSLNRYSYAENRPTAGVDPSGHEVVIQGAEFDSETRIGARAYMNATGARAYERGMSLSGESVTIITHYSREGLLRADGFVLGEKHLTPFQLGKWIKYKEISDCTIYACSPEKWVKSLSEGAGDIPVTVLDTSQGVRIRTHDGAAEAYRYGGPQAALPGKGHETYRRGKKVPSQPIVGRGRFTLGGALAAFAIVATVADAASAYAEDPCPGKRKGSTRGGGMLLDMVLGFVPGSPWMFGVEGAGLEDESPAGVARALAAKKARDEAEEAAFQAKVVGLSAVPF